MRAARGAFVAATAMAAAPQPRDGPGALLELQCSICRDLFDDAVLARDGFPYCRGCIVQWAGHGERGWRSPRTNEAHEGHPVLRGDVERDCRARELRLAQAMCDLERDPDGVGGALDLTHAGLPLLGRGECSMLVWHAKVLGAPYLQLAALWRAELLELLPDESLRELCRMDRHCVRLPLLEMEVLRRLLREAVRRCRQERDEEHAQLLHLVKDHFCWRANVTDAVELPPSALYSHRNCRPGTEGLYYRAWLQSCPQRLLFVKGQAVNERRVFLSVPLRSDRLRGACEAPFLTRLSHEPPRAREPVVQEEEESLLSCFASEALLTPDSGHWRRRRGGLVFPDSRGAGESDDEDWEETAPEGCSAVLQRQLRHLPRGFLYHASLEDTAHYYEQKAELAAAMEVLLELCEEGVKAPAEGRKRARVETG